MAGRVAAKDRLDGAIRGASSADEAPDPAGVEEPGCAHDRGLVALGREEMTEGDGALGIDAEIEDVEIVQCGSAP